MQWRDDHRAARGVLTIRRRSNTKCVFQLSGNNIYPAGTTASIRFYNSYGQNIGEWVGVVNRGAVSFDVGPALGDRIPADSSFELIAMYGGTIPRLELWGNVVRDEARYPNDPSHQTQFDKLVYSYSFLTPGKIVDPSWRILNGAPTVWDNSGAGKPNAAACGILFDDGAMMWYAPMATDSIRINYTLKASGAGKCTLGFCSNYDGTNWMGVTHQDDGNNDKLLVEVGTGPVNMSTQLSQPHNLVDLANYTAEYNYLTNTVTVWKGTDLTPLLSWVDSNKLVNHGVGERYFMFNWRAALFSPGPELVSFKILDA